MMRLVDSHCHLDMAEFSSDLAQILARGRETGIAAFVVPATVYAGWPGLAALAAAKPDIKPAYGLHPMFLAEHRSDHLDALPGWLARPECVAVGECGLDFSVPGLDMAHQENVFIEHVSQAKAVGKPLIIHARKATERIIQLLRRHGPATGVVHSYSGSLEQARQLADMGFLLGIGGPVTYPRSRRLQAIVRELPLTCLLLETDAPDQPMSGEQGRRNEPAKLANVLRAVAELRGQRAADIAEATTANAERLFGFAA